MKYSYLHMHLGHPLHIVVQPSPSFLCCPMLSSHPPSILTLVYLVPALHFHHEHRSGHTVLIPPHHVSKPCQYSLIHSALKLPFYSSSSMHLFILNSIHSWHSHQAAHCWTLYLKNIHFPSLISFHTPCLCSMQCCWYNYSFMWTLLTFIPNLLFLCTLYRALHALYSSFIQCITSLSHLPSAATCYPNYLKQSTSSNSFPLVSHTFDPIYISRAPCYLSLTYIYCIRTFFFCILY